MQGKLLQHAAKNKRFRTASPESQTVRLPALIAAGYIACLVALLIVSRFAILSNDFFLLRFQALHLSLDRPESLYNGFFPIGYPLLLKLLSPFGSVWVNILALLGQALLAGTYAWLFSRLALRRIPPPFVPMSLPVLLFFPYVLRAILSATPDFLASLAALGAIYVYQKESSQRALRRTGILLGLGLLLRSHILVLLVTLLVSQVVLNWRRAGIRHALWIVLGAVPFFLLQGSVQLIAGHGFFESEQSFNVWKTLYGMDWSHPPVVKESSLALILRDPWLFLRNYWEQLVLIWYVLIPLLAAFLHAVRRSDAPRKVLYLSAFLYLLIAQVGSSPRSVLPVLPLALLGALEILASIRLLHHVRPRALRIASASIGIALTLAALAFAFIGAQSAANRREGYIELANQLGMKEESDAAHIYSDDFALYFPQLNDAQPIIAGGWGPVGLPVYRREQPVIDERTAEALYISVKSNGIERIVLHVPALDERLAELLQTDSDRFTKLHLNESYSVYLLK